METWYERAVAGLQRVSLCMALLVAVGCVVVTARLAMVIVSSDMVNVRGIEPFFVHTLQRMLGGQRLYQPTEAFPFEITQYSPLYYYCCLVAAKALGVGAGEVQRTMLVARGLSCVFHVLQVAAVFALLVRILRVDKVLAALACCCMLVCPAPWLFLARPDALCSLLLLAFVCMAVVSLASEKGSRRADLALGLAAVFGVAAGLTKQNGFQGSIILITFFLFLRDWRRLGIAVGATAISMLLAGCGLYLRYGAAFAENVISGVGRSGVDLRSAFDHTYSVAFLHMNTGVLVAVCAPAVLQWFRPRSRPHEKFLAYAWCCFLGAATISALKFGSAHNYYNEFLVLGFACAAYFLSQRAQPGAEAAGSGRVAVAVAAFLVLYLPHLAVYNTLRYQDSDDRVRDREPMAAYLRSRLDTHPDSYVISRDITMASFFPARSVVGRSSIPAPEGEPVDGLNFAGLETEIADGRARYFVAREYHRPSVVLAQIGVDTDAFQLLKRDHGFEVWVKGSDQAGGLATNGSFEHWTDGAPDGWRVSAPEGLGQSADAFDGGRAVQMPDGDWAGVRQRIRLDRSASGAALLVSARVKASLSNQCVLKVEFGPGPGVQPCEARQNAAGEWTRVSLACSVPVNAGPEAYADVQLMRRPGLAGLLLVDDVSVTVEN